MTIKFKNVGKRKLSWSVNVGSRSIAPVESEIVRCAIGTGGISRNSKNVIANYHDIGEAPTMTNRTGEITASGKVIGTFEVEP